MATTTISLPDDQIARLRLVALSSRRSLDEVVRDAIDAYLASLPESATPRVIEPPPGPPSPEWQARFDEALARIRARVPADLTPEEIDAEIDAAWQEVRQERRARRMHNTRSRVIEPTNDIPDAEWQARFDAVTERIRQAGPTDLTPEEIEREITLAREEARQVLAD